MRNKKDKKSMKTYKMTVSIQLNHADSPPLLNSTVSKLLLFLSPPRLHVLLHQCLCLINFALFSLNLLLKLVINLFLGSLVFILEALLLNICTILPNCSYLILLVMFQIDLNIRLFVNLSCRLNASLLK